MSKKVEVPTTAAIFLPFRSSTFVSPASFRATMAPSTAVATPVTLSGTPSSNAFAASEQCALRAVTAALRERVCLGGDLGPRPAELEVRETDLAFALGSGEPWVG